MGQRSSKKKRLCPSDVADLIAATEFTEAEIGQWYTDFMQDCKSGKLSMDEFKEIYKQFFPEGDATQFAELVFHKFDANQDGSIDFREFLCSLSATTRGEVEDKLKWAFSMYDLDHDGFVTRKELFEIVSAIYKMMPPSEEDSPDEAQLRTDTIMNEMDKNGDDKLSLEEFVAGAVRDPSIVSMLTMS